MSVHDAMTAAALAAILGLMVGYSIGKSIGLMKGWRKARQLYGQGADFWYEQSESYRKLVMEAVEIGRRRPPAPTLSQGPATQREGEG